LVAVEVELVVALLVLESVFGELVSLLLVDSAGLVEAVEELPSLLLPPSLLPPAFGEL